MKNADHMLNENLLLLHEKFPRIGKALEFLWGDKAFPDFASRLVADGRSDRQGFPIDVMTAIIQLTELHDQLYPEYAKQTGDVWISSQFGAL